MIRILLLLLCIAYAVSLPGGWNPINEPNKDAELYGLTIFAAKLMYPNIDFQAKIVEAQRQVVAGMKYDVKVQIYHPSSPGVPASCTVEHFEIFSRPWTQDKNVLVSEHLPELCKEGL